MNNDRHLLLIVGAFSINSFHFNGFQNDVFILKIILNHNVHLNVNLVLIFF